MTKKISTGQAKAQFSALVDEVAYAGQRIVVERRGKPLAALVSIDDLERLEQFKSDNPTPQGALALVGIWGELEDTKLDSLLSEIYSARELDTGRTVEFDS